MRERPRGAMARATAVAEGFAVAARRRAQDREPRIVLGDEEGMTFLLKPSARGYDAVLEAAERMAEVATPAPAEGRRGARAQK
jgi:hypothetical protein